MDPLMLNVSACAVAILYCVWKNYRRLIDQKQLLLRERVAFMLWKMAERGEERRTSLLSH
jgi:hypothetical protein